MALTDTHIRHAKPGKTPRKLPDDRGLYIEIRPTGAKLWRYRYRIGGKENVSALGEYPEIGLQEAREDRDAARKLVKQGIHPAHRRAETKAAATPPMQTLSRRLQHGGSLTSERPGRRERRGTPNAHS